MVYMVGNTFYKNDKKPCKNEKCKEKVNISKTGWLKDYCSYECFLENKHKDSRLDQFI